MAVLLPLSPWSILGLPIAHSILTLKWQTDTWFCSQESVLPWL